MEIPPKALGKDIRMLKCFPNIAGRLPFTQTKFANVQARFPNTLAKFPNMLARLPRMQGIVLNMRGKKFCMLKSLPKALGKVIRVQKIIFRARIT